MWWVVFDTSLGRGGEENAVRCLVCNFCLLGLLNRMCLKYVGFLLICYLGSIIELCHLLFFVGGRADLCFLDGFLFLDIQIGRLFSLLWTEDGHEFCFG